MKQVNELTTPNRTQQVSGTTEPVQTVMKGWEGFR